MADTKKQRFEKLTLPAGRARWIAVNKPLTTHKPEGEYSVDVVLTPEQAKPLIAKFDALTKEQGKLAAADEKFKTALKKARTKAKDEKLQPGVTSPIVPETDEDGEPTGNYVVRCKQKGQFTRKDGSVQNVTIPLVDAKRNPVKVNLGKGSVVRVGTSVVPYFSAGLLKYGVSLRIEAVQVIECVEYRGGTDINSMFSEEDGYEGSEDAAVGSGDSSAVADGGSVGGADAAEADFA